MSTDTPSSSSVRATCRAIVVTGTPRMPLNLTTNNTLMGQLRGDYTYYSFEDTDTNGVMLGVGYKF